MYPKLKKERKKGGIRIQETEQIYTFDRNEKLSNFFYVKIITQHKGDKWTSLF